MAKLKVDGKEIEVIDIEKALPDSNEFAAVFPMDGMLLVSTRDRVIAFGK